MGGERGPWFSKEEGERAIAQGHPEEGRKDLAKHPRKAIELTPAEQRKALVVKDAAKFWNVPDHFVLAFVNPQTGDVAPYITKAGKLWILAQHHPRSVQTKVEPHPSVEGGWIATAEIVPDLSEKDRDFISRLAGTQG